MRRRSWLLGALAACLATMTTDRLEAAVNTTLYFDTLDDDLFPELKPGPGRKGIQVRVLAPQTDPRVPAPPKATSLLVVFRLDEPPPILDPLNPPPGWQIQFDSVDADGTPHRHTLALRPRPRGGNFSQHAKRDPNAVRLPGMIYRGALWTDLSPLYEQRIFRTGLPIEVGYAGQGATRVALV